MMTVVAMLFVSQVPVDTLTPGNPVTFAGFGDAVTAVALSPDGGQLGAVSRDGTLRLFSLSTGAAQVIDAGSRGLSAVDFSADGQFVVVGDRDFAVRFFSSRGDVLARWPHPDPVVDVRVGADGLVTVVGSGDNAAVYGPDGGTVFSTVARGLAVVPALGKQPARVLASRKAGTLDEMPLRKGAKPTVVLRLPGSQLVFSSIAKRALLWSPWSSAVLVAEGAPLSLSQPVVLPTVTGDNATPLTVTSVSLSTDGAVLAVGGSDNMVRVFSLPSRVLLAAWPVSARPFVALSGDGSQVAVADGAKVRVWPARQATR